MAIQTVQYPSINGLYPDFSSVEFSVPGYPSTPPYGGVLSIQSIDYSDSLEAGELRGAAPQLLARTRGKYTAEGKIKLPKIEADGMLQVMSQAGAALGRPMGYLEYGALTITVPYYEPSISATPIVDSLIGFRFKKPADARKTGQDPLMVDLDFSLFMLVRNGKYPFDPATLQVAFGIPQTNPTI